jgi:hypothetical protein
MIECLDHLLISGERHLYRVIQVYIDYFNYFNRSDHIKILGKTCFTSIGAQHGAFRPGRCEGAST